MQNSDIAQLQAEHAALSVRGNELYELSKKRAPTDDETAEIQKTGARLGEIREAVTKATERENTVAVLKASLDQGNQWAEQVPASNRPGHVYDVKSTPAGGHYPQPGMVHPGLVNKAYRPEIEPKGETVEAYLAEGYSLDTIEKACTPAYKREILKFMRSGGRDYAGAGDIVRKAFTEGVAAGTAGGGAALVPIQWSELIMTPPQAGMLQDAVRTIPTTTLTTRFPRVKTTDNKYPAYPVTVSWGGETPASPTDQGSNMTVEQIDINVNEVWAYGLFSISLLEDNAYGLSTLIPDIFQKSLAVATDLAIISGSGSSQPYGLTESSVVTQITATTTGAVITYQDLINMFYQTPQQFRTEGAWLMNSATLGAIAGLVDSQSRPLFLPNYGFIGATPGGGTTWANGSLLGRPIIISENVPSLSATAGTLPLYYADWKSAYYMLDRVSPTIKVNDQPAYKNGSYEFVLRARRGGRVVQPNAIRVLKSK